MERAERMTDHAHQHTEELERLHNFHFGNGKRYKHLSSAARTEAGKIIEIFGWEALKKEMEDCGTKNLTWSTLVFRFRNKWKTRTPSLDDVIDCPFCHGMNTAKQATGGRERRRYSCKCGKDVIMRLLDGAWKHWEEKA